MSLIHVDVIQVLQSTYGIETRDLPSSKPQNMALLRLLLSFISHASSNCIYYLSFPFHKPCLPFPLLVTSFYDFYYKLCFTLHEANIELRQFLSTRHCYVIKVKFSTCLTKHHAMKTYLEWRYSSTHS
jgi:hypothetical protein